MFVVSVKAPKLNQEQLLLLVGDVVELVSNKWDKGHSWFSSNVEIVMAKEQSSEIHAWPAEEEEQYQIQ